MSKINIIAVEVSSEVVPFSSPFHFEVHFQCTEQLKEPVEFRLVYIGHVSDDEYDQVLDRVELDDVPPGVFKFELDSPAPDPYKIPPNELIGVTIVLISGFFRREEFVRVGYYTEIAYNDPELMENPPIQPVFEKLTRKILADDPRITRYKIQWDDPENEADEMRDYFASAENYIKKLEERYDDANAVGATAASGSSSPPAFGALLDHCMRKAIEEEEQRNKGEEKCLPSRPSPAAEEIRMDCEDNNNNDDDDDSLGTAAAVANDIYSKDTQQLLKDAEEDFMLF